MASSHGDGWSTPIDACGAPARPGRACSRCCQWEYSAWYTAGYSSSKAPHGNGEQDKPSPSKNMGSGLVQRWSEAGAAQLLWQRSCHDQALRLVEGAGSSSQLETQRANLAYGALQVADEGAATAQPHDDDSEEGHSDEEGGGGADKRSHDPMSLAFNAQAQAKRAGRNRAVKESKVTCLA